MVSQFFLFGVASGFRHEKLRSGFAELAELRVHLEEDLVARVLFGEHRLIFRDGLLGHVVTLLAPIPRLPGEENSNSTDILRQEVDSRGSEIVGLDRDVGRGHERFLSDAGLAGPGNEAEAEGRVEAALDRLP